MNLKNARFQYYVEGECEKKLIRTLSEHNLIIPGKTDVLNPIQRQLKSTHLRTLSPKTTVVLVFDTDIKVSDTLLKNISFLKAHRNILRIITIPQVRNLEEELLRCTDISHIRDLVNCKHDSDFKSAFIEDKQLFDKLQAHHFDIGKLWSSIPEEPFRKNNISNQGNLIKIK